MDVRERLFREVLYLEELRGGGDATKTFAQPYHLTGVIAADAGDTLQCCRVRNVDADVLALAQFMTVTRLVVCTASAEPAPPCDEEPVLSERP